MKKLLGVILAVFITFIGGKVSASTFDATFAYSGAKETKVGEIYEAQVVIKDIKNLPITGIVALVNYDKEYLEFVSITPLGSPLAIFTNLNTVKFAGLSLTGEGISDDKVVLTIAFKPIKKGSTILSFSELELCDTKANSLNGLAESFSLNITNDISLNEEAILPKNEVEKSVVETINNTSEKIETHKAPAILEEIKEQEEKKPEPEKKESILAEEEKNIPNKEINVIQSIFKTIIDIFKNIFL